MSLDEKKISVTVVIPVFNGQETIGKCLRAFDKQVYSSDLFKVLVIDNGSTDNTEDIIKSSIEHLSCNVEYILEERKGVTRARNRGISESNSDVILFTDDDCVVHPGWIQEMVNVFEDDDVGAVQGKINLATKLPKDLIYTKEYINERMASVDHGPEVFEMKEEDLVGANMGIRTSVAKEIKGFNASETYFLCEDPEISLRLQKLGIKRMYVPKAEVNHYFSIDRVNNRSFLRQSFFWGRANIILEPAEVSKWRYMLFCIKQLLVLGGKIAFTGLKKNKFEVFKTKAKFYGYLGRINGLLRLKEKQI